MDASQSKEMLDRVGVRKMRMYESPTSEFDDKLSRLGKREPHGTLKFSTGKFCASSTWKQKTSCFTRAAYEKVRSQSVVVMGRSRRCDDFSLGTLVVANSGIRNESGSIQTPRADEY